MHLSFSTANYVGRAAGYKLEPFSWREAEHMTVERTDITAFDKICQEIEAAGFSAIDLWKAHAWPLTFTPQRADELLAVLRRHNLEPVSYAGEIGVDAAEMLRAARLLGIGLVCGALDIGMARYVATLARQRSVRVGIENDGETHPSQLRDKIGIDDDILGVCVDTGAWLAQGCDPAQAIRELGEHVWHVHLKDMRSWGSQEQVRLGNGVLDLEAVLAALRAIGYIGALAIEQETGDADPTADVRLGREVVERLLAT
ncbi:MAG: sugar phosphate isomerase/epimerase [Chloroflexales bacterium]|nr:sugar phosphate isomerase/epimerase [Chloroflexales bacterium]